MTDPTRTDDPTATDTSEVFAQAQDGDAGQVSRSGLYPTLDADEARAASSGDAPGSDDVAAGGVEDDGTDGSGADDPEIAGADLDEDQEDGRGPTIEPGA